MDLTKRQQEIFDFIKRYSAKHGYPPTVRDIGKAVGLASSSTVHAHLANLEKARAAAARSVEAAGDRAARPRAAKAWTASSRPAGLPLVGQVAAGQPILAEENIEEYVEVPDVVGGEDGEYILRVRGESMKDAGHPRGRLRRRAPPGDAPPTARSSSRWSGEEATVKRFFQETDHVRLQPENETHGADPHHATCGSSAGSWASSGGSRDATARRARAPTRRARAHACDAGRERSGRRSTS